MILSLTILQDFHHCGLEPGDQLKNYSNPVEVRTCQLEGLAEYAHFHNHKYETTNMTFSPIFVLSESSLATDTDYVRGKLADFGNDLLNLGVDEFRLDAAKRKGLGYLCFPTTLINHF